jgi:predicted DNA-binding protein with PD1-like motif
MRFRKAGDATIVRLEMGERIIETLTALCASENIRAASISGVGTCVRAELGSLDWESKTHRPRLIEEHCEIAALVGNVSRQEGRPVVHLHATLADAECRAYGGHLREAVVQATAEIIITILPGELPRSKDPATGLNLIKP